MWATIVPRAITPALAISAVACVTRSQCGDIKGGESIAFRPPGWVFGVAWSLLYVVMGTAWAASRRRWDTDLLFIGIVTLCCAWLPLYSCAKAKKVAAVVLLTTALLSWTAFATVKGWQGWILILLALWTSFATVLNVAEINQ